MVSPREEGRAHRGWAWVDDNRGSREGAKRNLRIVATSGQVRRARQGTTCAVEPAKAPLRRHGSAAKRIGAQAFVRVFKPADSKSDLQPSFKRKLVPHGGLLPVGERALDSIPVGVG
jgi:hypothetical protein